jgi:hypothetical protein
MWFGVGNLARLLAGQGKGGGGAWHGSWVGVAAGSGPVHVAGAVGVSLVFQDINLYSPSPGA